MLRPASRAGSANRIEEATWAPPTPARPATAGAPAHGGGPGRAATSIAGAPATASWRFAHPPINTITATTVAELAELVDPGRTQPHGWQHPFVDL